MSTNDLIMTVDPGDRHVGVAVWEYLDPSGWHCAIAIERTPLEFERELIDAMEKGLVGVVVIEDFRLDGSLAAKLAGSRMETAKLIGVVEYLGRHYGVPVVLQDRQIKTPTRNILRARKTKSRARMSKAGDHAFDAELHGHYYLAQQGETVTNPQE